MNKNSSYFDVVISSRIRLARNFNNVPFPAKLFDDRAFELQEKVFLAIKDLGDFSFYQISSLNENTKGVLIEKHLISKNLSKNKFSAVILNSNETVSLMINEEDHIREQAIVKGFNLKLAYNKLSKIDDAIIEKCDIAYRDDLGFLTTCPTNLGTGLRASCMLFLPALSLSGKMPAVFDEVKHKKQTIRGFYGEGSSADGYIYQISNQTTLGKSEFEIIEEVENTIYDICSKEITERITIFKENGESLKNKAKNSLNELLNAESISIRKFMENSAIIKLYLFSNDDLKAKSEVFDDLISIVQPCSLMELSGGGIKANEIDKFRTQYLKKILKNVIQI